jgi:TRAP-type transport system periplasmic protein
MHLSRGRFLGVLGNLAVPTGIPMVCRAAGAGAYTLRLNNGLAATSALGITASRFAAAVARRSNGQLQIEVYPNYQLAKESETIEALTSGVIDFVTIASSVVVPLVPRLQIFAMPFLFKDVAAGFRVLDGPVGTDLSAELASKGILALGWGASGMREFGTTTKSVLVPDDLKGLRVRVQTGAIYIAMFQALGAIPVVIDSSEAFIAVSQHTVDAVDYALVSLVSGKYYTVIKHVAMLNQMFSPTGLFASKRKIDALPLPLQKIIKEEAKAAVPTWRSLSAREALDNVETLKKNDVLFTEPQYQAFRKAMDPVYAVFRSQPGGDLLDRVGRATS